MKPEIRQCQNCKKDFTIEPDDFAFYDKIKVPAPTWCPECRMIRRLSCANSWSLFFRNCDKCGKRVLSMYGAESKLNVYCQPCWWADDWDGTEYGMDYDSSKPFFAQWKELASKTPCSNLETAYLTLKNCEYTNSIGFSKNCMLANWADYCENVYHSSILNENKDIADCTLSFSSELCYESIWLHKSYRVFYSEECTSCTDVWFSRNCYGCMNCIGCVNLRGSSYKIFNVQYSKEDYAKKIEEMKLDTYSGIEVVKEESREFWKKFPYKYYTGDSFNLNITGEYVHKSKNSKEMYICGGAEDCKYCQFITFKPAKDCRDYSGWGHNAELIYESLLIGTNVSNIKFSAFCFPDVMNLEYCLWVISGKNNFGCVNLKRKNYCILNKQYSKEEYEKLREQIIKDMEKNPYVDENGRVWKYGEFFLPGFARFAYNNSNANKFMPKMRDKAIALGYEWNDEIEKQAEATLDGNNLPESVSLVTDSVLKEIISCVDCGRRFKIAQLELELLRKMNLPLPRECLKCREDKRFARIKKPKLYDRECMKCGIYIRTSFAPERSEIIYCEKCYQGEFA